MAISRSNTMLIKIYTSIRYTSTNINRATYVLTIIIKLVTSIFGFITYKEDPYDQFRSSFESRIPDDRLERDQDGKYVDPVIAAKWKKLCNERREEVMAKW